MSTFSVQSDSPPLREEDDGSLRVGGSRVLLELVVGAFRDGATPESIVQKFPALTLADVYAVIAYYLRHRGDVEQYLARRDQQGADVREAIERHQGDLADIRRRLSALREAEG